MKFCAPVVQHIFGLRTPLPLLWRLNYLPPSLAAGLDARYQPRVVRSPAARAPGVRSGRSCHTQPTRGRPVCCHHALVRARPIHQPTRAAKAHCSGNSTATARHRQPSLSCSTSSRHPVAPARSRSRAATAPLATLVAPASTREHLRALGVSPAHPHGRKPTRAPTDRRRP